LTTTGIYAISNNMSLWSSPLLANSSHWRTLARAAFGFAVISLLTRCSFICRAARNRGFLRLGSHSSLINYCKKKSKNSEPLREAPVSKDAALS
jgi:hypothetical protein